MRRTPLTTTPRRQPVVGCCVSAANNLPLIAVNGDDDGSLTRRWTVLEESSVSFITSDADNEPVTMYAWMPLPSDSSLDRVPNSDSTWEFTWTPMNMDPVLLM